MLWAACTLGVLVLLTSLWLELSPPALSRQEAISAALEAPWGGTTVTDRVDAKLIHRSDLAGLVTDDNPEVHPWDRVWLVGAHGNLGVAATMSLARPTWSVAVIPDQKPARVEAYAGSAPEIWPPFWNKLWDLSLAR
jgi:hypothetical protein